MTPAETSRRIRQIAIGHGFDAVGFARASHLPGGGYYKAWIEAGHAGSMRYLARDPDKRCDPRTLLPGARSVICLAASYARPKAEDAAPAAGPPSGRVARYARGRDYHRVLHERLAAVIAEMRAQLNDPFEARAFVDTGPIVEREWAARAGIGWIGKNTLVLHPQLGSYIFLCEIVTTLDLPPDPPATDHCGTCTRCLDACPTDAFPAPYQMDASRCISYLTIEHRGDIDPDLAGRMDDWVFGCDICQEVCPFNTRPEPTADPALGAAHTPPRLPLDPLVELRASGYRRLTRGTALTRATAGMLRRNAAIARANAARRDQPAETSATGTESS